MQHMVTLGCPQVPMSPDHPHADLDRLRLCGSQAWLLPSRELQALLPKPHPGVSGRQPSRGLNLMCKPCVQHMACSAANTCRHAHEQAHGTLHVCHTGRLALAAQRWLATKTRWCS